MAAETAGFRGPVRENDCVHARRSAIGLRHCESVAGGRNPWMCGCKLVVDVSQNVVAG